MVRWDMQSAEGAKILAPSICSKGIEFVCVEKFEDSDVADVASKIAENNEKNRFALIHDENQI